MALRHTFSFRPRSRGFTFTEVLFAVILLGLGFIMLAGMFPVAIQQTQTTAEETAATILGQRAVRQISGVTTNNLFPSTNGMEPLSDNAWRELCGSMIDEKDPRRAWVALYRRNSSDRYMHVIVIALQARHEGSVFTVSNDFRRETYRGESSALVDPRPVKIVSVTPEPGTGIYQVRMGDAPDLQYIAEGACAEGVYVVHKASGRHFRLGRQVGHANNRTWEMAAGHGLTDEDVLNWSNADAWIVGRPFVSRDPLSRQVAGDDFQGYPMDIGLYSTFILVR